MFTNNRAKYPQMAELSVAAALEVGPEDLINDLETMELTLFPLDV
jgi:hypothetical protein